MRDLMMVILLLSIGAIGLAGKSKWASRHEDRRYDYGKHMSRYEYKIRHDRLVKKYWKKHWNRDTERWERHWRQQWP